MPQLAQDHGQVAAEVPRSPFWVGAVGRSWRLVVIAAALGNVVQNCRCFVMFCYVLFIICLHVFLFVFFFPDFGSE